MSKVAFVPLRAGGKRIGLIDGKDKERAILGGHPLAAWTIRHAIDSNTFDKVIAVTRSWSHAQIAKDYGVDEVLERPEYTVADSSPDIEWVTWALNEMIEDLPEIYSILRVTSPFRTEKDIQLMDALFRPSGMHSARMVTPVEQHPGKMWVIRHHAMMPLLPIGNNWHSRGTQTLPKVFIQTAGMEMASAAMTLGTKTIAGSKVLPYVVEGFPALDVNTKFDWYKAEQAVQHGLVELPRSLQ